LIFKIIDFSDFSFKFSNLNFKDFDFFSDFAIQNFNISPEFQGAGVLFFLWGVVSEYLFIYI
jgi:hypothetical protein